MQSQAQFFVGFGKLEDLIARHNPDESLMVSLVTAPGRPDKLGCAAERVWVVAQEIIDNRVHYCRLLMGGYTTINGGQPFGDAHEKVKARGEAAYKLVLDYIKRCGITPLENVTVAAPDNLTLLTGSAGFLRYDKQLDQFVVADESESVL